MKKFFALIAFFVVLAFAFNNASAQGNNQDEATNWFDVYVHVPILVTPLDMDLDPNITSRVLPPIAPGTTVNYPTPALVDMQFSVEGGIGASYQVDVDVEHQISTSGNPPNDNLTLNGLIWSADLNVPAPGYYGSADLGDPGSVNGFYTGWGPITFGSAGRDIFRVYPSSMTAGPMAVSGNYTFEVTLMAYYI